MDESRRVAGSKRRLVEAVGQVLATGRELVERSDGRELAAFRDALVEAADAADELTGADVRGMADRL